MIKERIKWSGPLSLPASLSQNTLYHTNWAGKRLVVIRTNGGVKAFENKCPHQGFGFQGGTCVEGMVICPIHRFRFRLEDGRGLDSPGQNLELLTTDERPDGIYIGREYLTVRLFGYDLW